MNWRVTLRQWIDLDEATRTELLNLDPTTMPRRGFNEQKGMDIDWGAMVNVVGTTHGRVVELASQLVALGMGEPGDRLALPLVAVAADVLGRAGAPIGQRLALLLDRLRSCHGWLVPLDPYLFL
jgi:hypothetical protein